MCRRGSIRMPLHPSRTLRRSAPQIHRKWRMSLVHDRTKWAEVSNKRATNGKRMLHARVGSAWTGLQNPPMLLLRASLPAPRKGEPRRAPVGGAPLASDGKIAIPAIYGRAGRIARAHFARNASNDQAWSERLHLFPWLAQVCSARCPDRRTQLER